MKWGTFLALLLVFRGLRPPRPALDRRRGEEPAGCAVGASGRCRRTGGDAGQRAVHDHQSAAVASGKVAKPPGKFGKLLITLAPPLALITLALCFAMLSHRLLSASIRIGANDMLDNGIVVVLARATVILAALQVAFAIFESRHDPSTPPPEGAFSWRRFVPDPLLQLFGRTHLPPGVGARGWYYLFSPRGWVRAVVVAALALAWLASDRTSLAAIWAERAQRIQWSTALALLVLAVAFVVTLAPRNWRVALGSARPAGLLCIATIGATLCVLTNGTLMTDRLLGPPLVALLWIALLIGGVIATGWLADPNLLSMHGFYKARLTRAYLGASNAARENEENHRCRARRRREDDRALES
jgi:hypothetical protein